MNTNNDQCIQQLVFSMSHQKSYSYTMAFILPKLKLYLLGDSFDLVFPLHFIIKTYSKLFYGISILIYLSLSLVDYSKTQQWYSVVMFLVEVCLYSQMPKKKITSFFWYFHFVDIDYLQLNCWVMHGQVHVIKCHTIRNRPG